MFLNVRRMEPGLMCPDVWNTSLELRNKFPECVLEFLDTVLWIFLEACVPLNVLLVQLFDHLAPLTVHGTPTLPALVTQERHRTVVTPALDLMELLETELQRLEVELEVAVVETTERVEEVEAMEGEVGAMEVEVEAMEVEVEAMVEDIMEEEVGVVEQEREMETEGIQVEARITDVMVVALVETATNNLDPTQTKAKEATEEVVEEEESVLEMYWRLVLMFVLDFQLVFSQLVWADVPNDALAENKAKKMFATIQNCTIFYFDMERVVSNVDWLREIILCSHCLSSLHLNMVNPNFGCVDVFNQ